ncbi:MAG: sigma-70 family RNA polymerase sigma factor [Myxococcales bacterium]|nr:sigma-70 family RNA polymerase sigma factor [Myxococcales bacterium]
MTNRRVEFSQTVEPALDGLYATALRLTGSAADAGDLVQDALLLAYQGWDRFEAGTNVRAWLHRIQFNAFVSGYRRKKRERRALDVDADPSKAELFVSEYDTRSSEEDGGVVVQGLGRTVQGALDELSPEFRAVVVMADIAELSYREIADTLGCPIGTVMSRLHRARRMLAKKLAPKLGREVPAELQEAA